MQVDPEQVDACRVALAGGLQRALVELEVKRHLCPRRRGIPSDADGLGSLDVPKQVVILDQRPCCGELLDVGEVGIVLLTGPQLNFGCLHGGEVLLHATWPWPWQLLASLRLGLALGLVLGLVLALGLVLGNLWRHVPKLRT